MEPDEVIGTAALRLPNQDWLDPRYTEARPAPTSAAMEVSALYQAHAVGLIRLAYVMLGDRAAEDAVQDAFCGLFRNRAKLADTSRRCPTCGRPC